MKKLSIGDIVSRAWDLAVKHWPIFVLFTLVQSLFSGLGINLDPVAYSQAITSQDPELIREAFQVNYPMLTIAALIGIYLGFILLKMYVSAHQTGRPYTAFGDVFKVDINQLAIYFCVELVCALIVACGTLLCILPGIWLGVRLWYAPLLAATQGATFSEAFTKSWEMTRGHFWELFLMGLTMIGIAILGFCACFVGVFFAEVIVSFMLVVSFFMLKPADPEPAFEEYAEPEATAYQSAGDAYKPASSTDEPGDFVEVQ